MTTTPGHYRVIFVGGVVSNFYLPRLQTKQSNELPLDSYCMRHHQRPKAGAI